MASPSKWQFASQILPKKGEQSMLASRFCFVDKSEVYSTLASGFVMRSGWVAGELQGQALSSWDGYPDEMGRACG